ncbi:hypothetical protein AMJ49_04195, partial [Parcubacteria bacterium DG_74_2]
MKFSQKFFRRTTKTRILFFIISDTLLIYLSVYLAFLLRFDGNIPSQYFDGILRGMIILALGFCLFFFYFFKLYSFSWSYVSTRDLISLFKATGLSFLFSGAVLLIFRDSSFFTGFPRSVLFISYFLIFLFCGGFRFSKRLYIQLSQSKQKEGKERTLIVGAGDAGEQILRSIQSSFDAPYTPVGFIDDNEFKQGSLIHGVRVLGKVEDIPDIVKKQDIKGMIIALPSADSSITKNAAETGRISGLKNIKIIPSITEIINGKVSIRDLRNVQMKDLLGRKQISLNKAAITNFIQGRRILITGAAGSIGSELCRQIAKFEPYLLLLLDQDETGIFNISEEIKRKFPALNFSF